MKLSNNAQICCNDTGMSFILNNKPNEVYNKAIREKKSKLGLFLEAISLAEASL